MLATFLAATLLAPVVHLEAKLPKTTFQRGEKIRVEIYAVNDSNQEAVIGISGIGNFASGNMDGKVEFTGENKPELNHYNPNRGQIMIGPSLHVMEQDFAVIPPKGRKLVFFEQIDGEWKDGYTPWNVPSGLKAISIPARAGEYKFTYTYKFSRKDENARLAKASYHEGYTLDEHVIPERRLNILFEGKAKKLFETAVEGKWSVSGSFKIVS